jgi:hypothetical protein
MVEAVDTDHVNSVYVISLLIKAFPIVDLFVVVQHRMSAYPITRLEVVTAVPITVPLIM